MLTRYKLQPLFDICKTSALVRATVTGPLFIFHSKRVRVSEYFVTYLSASITKNGSISDFSSNRTFQIQILQQVL